MAYIWKNYKFRIYPNEEQVQAFEQLFHCTRFVNNHFVQTGDEYYQRNMKYPTLADNLSLLSELVGQHPFLQETDQESLKYAVINLDGAYTRHSSIVGYHPTEPKSPTNSRCSYKTKYPLPCFSGYNREIYLPQVGWIRIKVDRYILFCLTPLSVTVLRNPSDEYEVIFSMFAEKKKYDLEYRKIRDRKIFMQDPSGVSIWKRRIDPYCIPDRQNTFIGQNHGFFRLFSTPEREISGLDAFMNLRMARGNGFMHFLYQSQGNLGDSRYRI